MKHITRPLDRRLVFPRRPDNSIEAITTSLHDLITAFDAFVAARTARIEMENRK